MKDLTSSLYRNFTSRGRTAAYLLELRLIEKLDLPLQSMDGLRHVAKRTGISFEELDRLLLKYPALGKPERRQQKPPDVA